MEIEAQIVEEIKYKSIVPCVLPEISLEDFEINSAKSSCLIADGQNRLACSKWVSPKRTRSYPDERVYNTFSAAGRIPAIPDVKDEGAAGDRDFLQWETVSLMSLPDVYAIPAYYVAAEKHKTRTGKITNQKFDNEFVSGKIREIANYRSSALHWNLKELKNISTVLAKAKGAYRKIYEKTKVAFHGEKGIDAFAATIGESLSSFTESSRAKARSAQSREFLTRQPKEILSTQTKAKITITNSLGGKYYFTVDEIVLREDNLLLIESKHSKNGKVPSVGDIKDGLLKMMLYASLENVGIDGKFPKSVAVLRLTSEKLKGEISSSTEINDRVDFYRENFINKRQSEFLENLFAEARVNNFAVSLGNI